MTDCISNNDNTPNPFDPAAPRLDRSFADTKRQKAFGYHAGTQAEPRQAAQALQIENERRAGLAEKMAEQREARLAAIEALITETKALIVDDDKTQRQIAENLVKLRDKFDLSQRDLAEKFGKSPGWINRLLKRRRLAERVVADLIAEPVYRAVEAAA
jgi:ribosome-binding protein aMBF1 (putative translation factor)